MDVEISMEYPEKFQEGTNFFSPGVAYRFVSKEYSSEDFTFGLALCQAYKNMSLEKTLSMYSNGSIQEEKKINGKDVIINQAYDRNLMVLIPYENKYFAVASFKLKNLKNDMKTDEINDAYKKLYKRDDVQKMIDSIKLERLKDTAKTVERDKFSISTADRWFVEKDDENYIRLENCDIGDFRSYMDIFYNETVKAKIIVKNRTSPGDKVFTKKIAGVKYTVIKAPRIRMLRLVTPTKDGKGSIHMNVYYDVKLADILNVLKTVKLK